MDRKTRFLLASKLSERSDVKGAVQAFKEAIKHAGENQPYGILTDALPSYPDAIKQAFENVTAKKPKHHARDGLDKPHANNNRVERLHGALRERVNAQRVQTHTNLTPNKPIVATARSERSPAI